MRRKGNDDEDEADKNVEIAVDSNIDLSSIMPDGKDPG